MKLSAEEIGYIALFEKITGAVIKDCVTDKEENKILFVVKKGDMGLAIGKKGANIQRVRQAIGKKIEVIEYSEDPAEFVRNIFHPLRLNNVSVSNKVARVDMDDRDKMAMGRKNIKKAKMLAERHHNISIVMV